MPQPPLAIGQLVSFLDSPAAAGDWLRGMGVRDVARGHRDLVRMAESKMTLDLLGVVCDQLREKLPLASDPDMALNNLERFVAAARNPLALGSLLERDRDALPILLTIFSSSQYLSDYMIRDPESYDLLRLTEGQPVAREVLIGELTTEIASLTDEAAVMAALRRIKRRETLRIAYGDLIRDQPVDVVTRQISFLADGLTQAALETAYRKLQESRGLPRRAGAEKPYFTDIDEKVLADCIATYQQLGCWTPHVEITQAAFEKTLDVYEYNGLIKQRYRYDQVCAPPPAAD